VRRREKEKENVGEAEFVTEKILYLGGISSCNLWRVHPTPQLKKIISFSGKRHHRG